MHKFDSKSAADPIPESTQHAEPTATAAALVDGGKRHSRAQRLDDALVIAAVQVAGGMVQRYPCAHSQLAAALVAALKQKLGEQLVTEHGSFE